MLDDNDPELPDGPWLALDAAVVKGCDPAEREAWQAWAERSLPSVRVPRVVAGHGLGNVEAEPRRRRGTRHD